MTVKLSSLIKSYHRVPIVVTINMKINSFKFTFDMFENIFINESKTFDENTLA